MIRIGAVVASLLTAATAVAQDCSAAREDAWNGNMHLLRGRWRKHLTGDRGDLRFVMRAVEALTLRVVQGDRK